MQGQSLDSAREQSDDGAKNANQSLNLVDLAASDKLQSATRVALAETPQLPAHLSQSDKATVAPLSLRQAVAAGAADATKTCKTSPEYESRIDNVARRIFDPAALGNLQQLRSKYNCDIERTGDPLRYVKLALDKDDNDPYTSYLTPAAYKGMLESQRGKSVGVGVSFTMPTALEDKSGQVPPLVVQSYDATDARGRDLKPGDEVLSINGVSMQGKTWREGLRALDGPDQSKVSMQIKRDGEVKDITLTRTGEDVPNVTTNTVDGKFAHIQVKSFMNDNTSAQIEKAILDNPKAEGYILDLRNNGGGLLDQAMTSASVFISEGKVLNIKSRVPSDPTAPRYETDVYNVGKDSITLSVNGAAPSYYARRHPDRVDKPVVVLVDQGTASAAEILAGALKDTDGAYVIGTPTFGKGIGQTIFPDGFNGGATKITTFRYYTPAGVWPGDGHDNRIGLQPNLIVKNPTASQFNTASDGQVNAAAAYLRSRIAAKRAN